MVTQLLARSMSPEMEQAKANALSAENAVVKALDIAMCARQESAQVKDELERVRAELAVANAKAKECADATARAVDLAKKAAGSAEEASAKVANAVNEKDKAEKNAAKAVTDAEAAATAVETAQKTVYKAAEAYEKAQTVTKEEDENVKSIKKQAERAQWTLDDAKKAEATVVSSIPKVPSACVLSSACVLARIVAASCTQRPRSLPAPLL